MMCIRLSGNRNAQSTLFDAILFFVIILVASTVLYVYTAQLNESYALTTAEHDSRYVARLLSTVLGASIRETRYIDNAGNIVRLENETVLYLLAFDLSSRSDQSVSTQSLSEGVESAMNDLITNLTSEAYDYALVASYGDMQLFLSDAVTDMAHLPQSRFTSTSEYPIGPDFEDRMSVTLYVWR